MTTTHKTLRGPRGAIIFVKKDDRGLDAKIDRAVFPGMQGGPHMAAIAGIGQALYEALQPEYASYAKKVIEAAQALADTLRNAGWKLVTDGTDTHMVLIDVYGTVGISGKNAATKLADAGIIANMNMIPHDTRSPRDPSGIRLGTPAMVTRGLSPEDFRAIGKRIDTILRDTPL